MSRHYEMMRRFDDEAGQWQYAIILPTVGDNVRVVEVRAFDREEDGEKWWRKWYARPVLDA